MRMRTRSGSGSGDGGSYRLVSSLVRSVYPLIVDGGDVGLGARYSDDSG